MPPGATSTLSGPQRGSPGRTRPPLRAVAGRRGVPETISLRRTLALAPALEGVALAGDVIAACERIQTAAANGSRMAMVNEAGRLGTRATACLGEFRRLAGLIDGGAA